MKFAVKREIFLRRILSLLNQVNEKGKMLDEVPIY
jgi:hypothetical protein